MSDGSKIDDGEALALTSIDDPDMLEDLNEWRLDMEDDGESDGEFSMDQDQDFTDLERGNIERMRIPLDAEVDGGTDDDDGSGSDSDNEGNMEVELDWQPTPSLEHLLFLNKRKDLLARCSVAVSSDGDDDISKEEEYDEEYVKLKAAANDILNVGRFPLERVNHGKAIAADNDVLRAILYMLKGFQSDLFHLRREIPPMIQREFTLTSTALMVSTARLSAGVLEKVMRWFVNLGSKMMSCRVYARTALRQRDIPEQRGRMKTCHYTMLLECLGQLLSEIVVSFDRKIESVEKALESKVRPPTLLSLQVFTKSWLNFFTSVESIATKIFTIPTPRYFPLKVPSKEQMLLSDATFAAVMIHLEDIMETARVVGVDGCSADMADPIVKEWCENQRNNSNNASSQVDEEFCNSESGNRSSSFPEKDRSKESKPFVALLGPDCFHDLLRDLSVTEIVIDSLVPNFNSNPPPSSADSKSQGDHYRLKLKFTSTLRRKTLFPIICTQLYKMFAYTYLQGLMDWILTGGPRDDKDILDALGTCMIVAQGGEPGSDQRKHAKGVLTNLFCEIPKMFHDIACEAMNISSDIILIQRTTSTKTADIVNLSNAIKNGMRIFDDLFAQHPSNQVIDEASKRRGDSGHTKLPPAPPIPTDFATIEREIMHEERTYTTFPRNIMSNKWISSTCLYDDPVVENIVKDDKIDQISVHDNLNNEEIDEKETRDENEANEKKSGPSSSADKNNENSVQNINMTQVFLNAYKPTSMKIQDSMVTSVLKSLNSLSKTSSGLLRTDYALIEHLEFLQTVFTLRYPDCYDPLRWHVLDGLMCLKGEDEIAEYERRQSMMSYPYVTDDISASLVTTLQEETDLFKDNKIAYLTVRLPADVDIALMHEATNSIKSTESNSLDPHYRRVLFENPHKLAAGIDLSLDYKWPLTEIISRECLEDYNNIAGKLLEVSCISWQAQGIWQAVNRCALFMILNKDRRGTHRQKEDSVQETSIYISTEMSGFLDQLNRTRLGMHQCMYILQSLCQSYLVQIHEKIFPQLLSLMKNTTNPLSISQATVRHRKYAAQVCIMVLFSRDKINQIIATASRALRCLDLVIHEFNKYERELRKQEAVIANNKDKKTMLEQVEDIFEAHDLLKDNLSIADSNFKNANFYTMRLVDDLHDFLDDIEESNRGYTERGISQEDYYEGMKEWAIHLKTVLANISHEYHSRRK